MPNFQIQFSDGAFCLFMIELLKSNCMTIFQMLSQTLFVFQMDQYHQVFIEDVFDNEETLYCARKHFFKISIRRKASQGFLQASPQVRNLLLISILVF